MTSAHSSAANSVVPGKRAVLYLRVSTTSQVKTDYDPEGISIPAQREACERKAAQMGVDIVAEYIEPGRSGTSMDKRIAFQEMLTRIRTEHDVDYVLVYKLSRMNRNRVDDAMVLASLRRHKVTLVSATESIDETPVGQLMHGILASFNEYRSAEDGADIRYKMGEKAKRGGTIGRAPLGYRNVREEFDGRQVNTVAVDAERAPLVRLAFELYASGDYSIDRLQETMAAHGLSTRASARWASQPVSANKLHQMLRDPYYTGVVVYEGAEYSGRHEAIIDSALFGRVQAVMDARSLRGQRDRVHHHYLKGLLFCDRCHRHGRTSRLIYTEARGKGGTYAYYLCRGRQEGVCDLPYLAVQLIERGVAAEYGRLDVDAEFLRSLRDSIADTLADEQRLTRETERHLQTQLQRLDAAEDGLLDLAADGTMHPKIRTRLTKIEMERRELNRALGHVALQMTAGADALTQALDLMDRPAERYASVEDSARRELNLAFYEAIFIDEDGAARTVLEEPFQEILDANGAYSRRALPAIGPKNRHPSDAGVPVKTVTVVLADLFQVGGSSRTVMVERRRLELLTSAMRTQRSTN